MFVADDACNFPLVVFELPEHNELCVAALVFGVVGVGETVDAELDGAVVVEGVDFECVGEEGAVHFAADIVLDGGEEGGLADGEASDVVVELEVVRDHGAESGEVAMVVGVKEFGVESVDGIKERVGLGGGRGLGMRDGGEGDNEKQGDDEYAF